MIYFDTTIRKINPFCFTKNMVYAIITLLSIVVPQLLWATSTNTNIDLSVNNTGTTFTNWSYNSGTNTYTITGYVTVTGSVSGVSRTLTFDITSGVNAQWSANYEGSTSPASSSLITLSGGGALSFSSCTITNRGTGGVLNITGAGANISVGTGATISSGGSSGNPVLISASNVTLYVNQGGTVVSLDGNGSAALQIGSTTDIENVVININGGAVTSIGGGYAINEGAPTGTVNNNTRITVGISNNAPGVVTAGTACAIRSTSLNTTVTVNGGVVTNAAGNNANPTIYMNGGLGNNVFINSGSVQSTSTAGYAVQTTGNVIVTGGLVSAINGRAINLVGTNSKATVAAE